MWYFQGIVNINNEMRHRWRSSKAQLFLLSSSDLGGRAGACAPTCCWRLISRARCAPGKCSTTVLHVGNDFQYSTLWVVKSCRRQSINHDHISLLLHSDSAILLPTVSRNLADWKMYTCDWCTQRFYCGVSGKPTADERCQEEAASEPRTGWSDMWYCQTG